MASGDFLMPAPRYYSHQALYPGTWDPRCSPQFPLGNFWPVYLGNFWCDLYPEHATRVQEYFASKGLLVRMVFGRNLKDDPHFKYQRIYHLYDFLVYFVRQKDAEDAISYCHREMYYGHRLNVFPGRSPTYFDRTKSVKHVPIQRQLKMTEQVYETYIHSLCPVEISTVVQHHQRIVIVEYASVRDREIAIQNCRICTPRIIKKHQQKQRFIEQQVEQEICERFQKDPGFVNMLPPNHILSGLFNGIRFNGYKWRSTNKLRMPKQMLLLGRGSMKWWLHKVAFRCALRDFGVRCNCKRHARLYLQEQKRNEKKLAKPSSGDKPGKEVVAVSNAASGSNITPTVIAVQAPVVNLGDESADNDFYDDSDDIDGDFGIAF